MQKVYLIVIQPHHKMKKIFIICSFILLPCLAFAQNNSPLTDDVYIDFKGINNVIRLDNNINIMQVQTDNKSFDLVAYNENEKIIWQTSIPGYALNVGEFKGKIAAVAATEHSTMKGNGNTYKGFIIDPTTGKTITEKVIYDDNNDFIEQPNVMIGDNYFKFSMRQTAVTRTVHVGVPVLFIFQIMHWSKEMNETKKLEIIDFNDKLEVTNTFLAVPAGTFINLTCNKNSDTFVSWLNGSDIEVYKYDAGKTTPSGKLDADVSIEPFDDSELSSLFYLQASPTNPNSLFYTLLFRNEDKDPELMVGKMDFETKTKKTAAEVFKRADIKALEKTFVTVNKKIDDPDIGSPKELVLKNVCTTDNGIVVVLSGEYEKAIQNSSYPVGKSLLINAYDDDLNLKFQQFFPLENFSYPSVALHPMKNKLYVVTSTKDGQSNFKGVYGQLDMNTGRWDSMDFLTKKPITGYLAAGNILWFDKSYIVPYMKSHGMFAVKYNLSLQMNDY